MPSTIEFTKTLSPGDVLPPPPGGILSISTGSMLGGGRDVRKMYIDYALGDGWEETYSRSPSLAAAKGKLVTARMVQAGTLFDAGGAHASDMTDAEADANAANFIAAMPVFREAGVHNWVISLEGGNPTNAAGAAEPNLDNTDMVYDFTSGLPSPFTSDGTGWKTGRKERYENIINALSDEGMTCTLTLFYSRLSYYLLTQTNYRNAMQLVTDWIIENEWRHILIDLANEAGWDAGGSWEVDGPFGWNANSATDNDQRVANELDYFRSLWNGQPWRPPIGCSSRSKPGPLTIAESDVHWYHGNVAGSVSNKGVRCQEILDGSSVGPVVSNEIDSFFVVNDKSGCSGGTMLATAWQRWKADWAALGLPKPGFMPEAGISTDTTVTDYWTAQRNLTRKWLTDASLAATNGLPPRP